MNKSLIVNNLFEFYVLKPHCRVILDTVIHGTYYVRFSVARRIALSVLPLRQCYPISNSFATLLSCQLRVTVTSCFVYKVIRDLESIDHLRINPIRRIGLIHK